MPGTFSVPARRWRSCGPPWSRAATWTPLRTKRMPVPCGAYILWPEMLSRSTFFSAPVRSMGSLPAAWTASVWKRMAGLYALAMRASLPMGWMAPVSLLANMMETSSVSGRRAASKASGSMMPSRVGSEIGDLGAAAAEGLRGVEDGVVLDFGGEEVGGLALVEERAQDAVEREVVALGAAGGEDNFLGRAVEQAGDGGAGVVDGGAGALAGVVRGAGIAEGFRPEGTHGLDHLGKDGGGGVGVEVDAVHVSILFVRSCADGEGLRMRNEKSLTAAR